jgi:mannitol/fructose-specific phosphotransferase system IIA component (Ntr-type)
MSAFTSVLSNENFRNNLNKIKNYQDWLTLYNGYKG